MTALHRWKRAAIALIALGLAVCGSLWLKPADAIVWVNVALAAGLVLLGVLIWTTAWNEALAWAVAGLLVLGLGGLWGVAVRDAVQRAVVVAGTVDLLEPWWLLLLASIPLLVVISWPGIGTGARALDGGTRRRRLALGLRVLAVVCVAFALAEPRLRAPYDHTTVLFVLDRSASIFEEPREDRPLDLRWQRVRKFINEAVEARGVGRKRDQAGLIVFGRRPRLELLPTDAPRLKLDRITSTIDGSATDIGAALQLALASFAPDSAKRIVLLSDGSENRGSAAKLAAVARSAGVQIDVVPLAANRRQDSEVLVARVEAPMQLEQGAPLPLTVWLRSYSPSPVAGQLVVRQISERGTVIITNEPIVLELGLKPYPFRVPLAGRDESYTYEAEFEPRNLPGDRPQNNKAATHVMARGRRRVLLLESQTGLHQKLLETLAASGPARFEVEARNLKFLEDFSNPDRLTAWLNRFDSIVLANISAEQLTDDQQEALRAVTHDQGCGLVVVGGPESFGAGGWQGTAIEKALPVDCDIKGIETDDKAGLVLIMHASEMAEGNKWQKRIARLAIERLSPRDHVGILHYDFNVRWHIPMQPVGEDRSRLYRLVDRLEPGDMPDFDPALLMAHRALTEKARNLARKHVILISDGDPQQNNKAILRQMRRDEVTVTTVGVATHGQPQDALMKEIARATKGQSHFPKRPADLPAIYIKETRLVSQSFVHQEPFKPVLHFRTGPTAGLPRTLPRLGGFVRTTRKGSDLVEVSITTEPLAGQSFPLLASWNYGLGKAVAFTSDAGQPRLWCKDWAEAPLYGKFWEQVIDWSLRPVDSKNLTLTAHYRDGRIRIIVEALTDAGEPDLYLQKVTAKMTPPQGGPDAARLPELRFEQRSPGVYEAEMPADEAGSYFIGFQALRRAGGANPRKEDEPVLVRGSVTVPYAAEFADLESNPDLLELLREETGGEKYADDDEELTRVAKAGTVFREGLPGFASQQPVWQWLVFAAAVLLLCDVAMRRLALERLGIGLALSRLWDRLRGRGVAAPVTATLDRLQSRKAKVAEGLAARRFEPTDIPVSLPLSSEQRPLEKPTAPPTEVPPPAPSPGEQDDFMSRMLKAKKRVWKERDDETP